MSVRRVLLGTMLSGWLNGVRSVVGAALAAEPAQHKQPLHRREIICFQHINTKD